jgi:hypothetical protein
MGATTQQARTTRRRFRSAGRIADDLGYQLAFIGFCRFTNLLRLIPYAPSIHPRYVGRLLLLIMTSLATAPLRLWERVRYGRRIADIRIDRPPVFIIGHWRSGTTHLHNLMYQDPAFGCFTMYQAVVPGCTLAGGAWLKAMLARLVPLKRPMDEMVWPLDSPQEEEIGLAKVMPHSFYTQVLFPGKPPEAFVKSILLPRTSPAILDEFNRQYYRLLQVATLHAGGKTLLLKNPINTARISLLLRLFPDARFVHIHRSPYEVFASTRHLHRRLLPLTGMQPFDGKAGPSIVLNVYAAMMRQFLAERSLIPPGHLVEVAYADLERDPLGELRRIYDTLGLPGYAEVAPAIATYVAAQHGYRKNRLELTATERRQIEEHWAFAFHAFGYPLADERGEAT